MNLTEAQRQNLKKQAHTMKPVIIVGNAGVTDALLTELDSTIAHHELIKVKVNAGEREVRDALIETLLKKCGATLVGRVGNVATLYRAPKKGSKRSPKIIVPK